MQVVFMCGGKGTRMQASHSRPKSLTPIGDSTLATRLVEQFAPLHTSSKPPLLVVDGFDQQTPRELAPVLPDAKIIRQPQPDGVANALLTARACLDALFLVVLGDLFFDGHLTTLPRRACLVSWRDAPSQETRKNYGITTGADGQVTAVVEKPVDVAGLKCGVGLYVLTPAVVECFARAPVDARTGERGITAGLETALGSGAEFGHSVFRGFYNNVNCSADLAAIDRYRQARAV